MKVQENLLQEASQANLGKAVNLRIDKQVEIIRAKKVKSELEKKEEKDGK